MVRESIRLLAKGLEAIGVTAFNRTGTLSQYVEKPCRTHARNAVMCSEIGTFV